MADEGLDRGGWVLSFVTGMALWAMVAFYGGRAEPWDSELYWTAGYPLALMTAGIVGAAYPWRTWGWALGLMFAQIRVMVAGGSGLGMLPFGMVFLAILALPLMIAARLGAWLRSRLTA